MYRKSRENERPAAKFATGRIELALDDSREKVEELADESDTFGNHLAEKSVYILRSKYARYQHTHSEGEYVRYQ